MSNYGISDDIVNQLVEQYMADQQNPMYTGELSADQMNTFGMMPSYDLRGKPYTMTSMLNQLQDVNQLMADPMFQGSGGIGGFSQQAFEPTVTYERVDSPEYVRWQNYRNTPTSLEGMIAAELDGGGTTLSAVRKLQQHVEANPDSTVAADLMALYGQVNPDTGKTEIVWPSVTDKAQELEEMRAAIPPLGNQGSTIGPNGEQIPGGEIQEMQQPDGSMALVRVVSQPSELQQHFDELGLPSPFEEYTTESFMGPEWEGQLANEQQSQLNLQAARDAMLAADAELRGFQPGQQNYPTASAQQEEEQTQRDETPAVAQPYPDYRNPESPYVVPPIDITEEIPQQLEDAFANGTEGQWMAWNWPTLSQHDATNVREVLTQHNLHPQDFGYELQPRGTGPTNAEAVGMPNAGDVAESESGFLPGEAASALEGEILGGGGPANWLAGNYTRLTPQEQEEVDQTLRNYGLTAADYGYGQQGPAGQSMGASELIRRRAMMNALTQGDQPEPPDWEYPSRQEWEAAQGQPTAPPGAADNFYENIVDILGQRQGPPAPGQTEPGPFPPMPPDVSNLNYPMGRDVTPEQRNAIFGTPAGPQPISMNYPLGRDVPREVMLQILGQSDRTPQPPYVYGGSFQYPSRQEFELAQQQPQQQPPRWEYPSRQEFELAQAQPQQQPQQYQYPSRQEFQLAQEDAMRAQLETGERTDEGRAAAGGERRQPRRARTGEERAALARALAPRDAQGEDYEVTTGMGGQLGGRRGRSQRAHRQFRDAWLGFQQALGQAYGYEEGRARGMAMSLRNAGVTPLQQVYAQRIANIQNAGIPLQNQPQVAQYR